MNVNSKIRLNFTAAYLSVLPGIIAIPGMLPESIAGSAMRDRKIIYLTDIDLALLCGIKADDVTSANSVLLDHADLPSRNAGLLLESHSALSSFIDFTESDPSINTDIHDVGTVLFSLSKPKALELGSKGDDVMDNDTVMTGVQGVSADLIADMAEPFSSGTVGKADLGSFFGTVSELIEKASIEHTANGIDKSPDALRQDAEAEHVAS